MLLHRTSMLLALSTIIHAFSLSSFSYAVEVNAGYNGGPKGVHSALNEKTSDIRSKLQQVFEQEDCTFLLAKKESMDSFMLPVFLPFEMQLNSPDYCRVLRFEYADRPVTYQDNGAFAIFINNLFQIKSMRDDQVLEYDLRQSRHPYISTEYPVTLQSTARLTKDSCILDTTWYEPYLANRGLDFTAHPECLRYGWDRSSLIMWPRSTNDAPIVEKISSKELLFDNPAYIYSLLDSLRMQKVVFRDNIKAESTSSTTSRIVTADGRIVREFQITHTGSGNYNITIVQKPVLLNHKSSKIAHIKKETGGKTLGTEKFQPSADVTYLGSGRTVNISFVECVQLGNKLFPHEISVKANGLTLYEAEILNARLASSTKTTFDTDALTSASEVARTKNLYKMINARQKGDVQLYSERELTEPTDGLTARRRIKFNIIAASHSNNFEVLDYTLREYNNRLKADRCNPVNYVYSLEAITELGYRYCNREAGDRLAFGYLSDAYRQCTDQELKEHVIRLLDQYRLGYALIALDVLGGRKPTNPTVAGWTITTRKFIINVLNGDDKNFAKPEYPGLKEMEILNETIFDTYNIRKGSKS
ncbi:hypothetical protein LLG95_16770 [bacterium]|nr:hypothetical protein [bacterium]